jgi:hypothetical protein
VLPFSDEVIILDVKYQGLYNQTFIVHAPFYTLLAVFIPSLSIGGL